jgi:nucleoside-diphosphate-sugar epimerase
MNALVTGAAGFIGSHLCRHLLSHGEHVRGVDCFTDYYPARFKYANLAPLLSELRFRFIEADLHETNLRSMLDGVDVVYHLAGQPGVRPSWGKDFAHYLRQNVGVTQRLLEAARQHRLRKFVYASSSSVYGNAESYPTSESARPQPQSPYGVTKLAAEHLCELYRANLDVRTASLRFFTVYGPGQRPDMAFSRLMSAALDGGTFELYGDGTQTRDFTFVEDVVRALRDVARSDFCGVANLGGGSRTSMNEVISIIEGLCGAIDVSRSATQDGDVRHTSADIRVAASAFGYAPRVTLEEGLRAMAEWACRTRVEVIAS